MDAIVPEARVTLDAGLFRENIVILSLQVADNLGEAAKRLDGGPDARAAGHEPRLVVHLVPEAGRIDDGQRDAGSLLVQLKLCAACQNRVGPRRRLGQGKAYRR